MLLPNFSFEDKAVAKGFKIIAGVDEVGRGAFAGPVVAGVVCFKGPTFKGVKTVVINDSKKLTAKQRELADLWIRENALAFGIGSASTAQVNKLGIKKATEVAFRKAIAQANKNIEYRISNIDDKEPYSTFNIPYSNIDSLLIDAFYIPRVKGLPLNRQKAIIKGDGKSLSIAAASIIAKVFRDRLMTDLSKKTKYKEYKWYKNKGYGTLEHRNAIKKHGITKLHRTAFVD